MCQQEGALRALSSVNISSVVFLAGFSATKSNHKSGPCGVILVISWTVAENNSGTCGRGVIKSAMVIQSEALEKPLVG